MNKAKYWCQDNSIKLNTRVNIVAFTYIFFFFLRWICNVPYILLVFIFILYMPFLNHKFIIILYSF